jgi:hypothetical protein
VVWLIHIVIRTERQQNENNMSRTIWNNWCQCGIYVCHILVCNLRDTGDHQDSRLNDDSSSVSSCELSLAKFLPLAFVRSERKVLRGLFLMDKTNLSIMVSN